MVFINSVNIDFETHEKFFCLIDVIIKFVLHKCCYFSKIEMFKAYKLSYYI
jgi:hypothetical protein